MWYHGGAKLLQINPLGTLDTDKEASAMAKKSTKKPTQQRRAEKPATKPTPANKPQPKSGK
jgi:hypothetical protein